MRKMTDEDKQKIAQQVEHFRSEKLKFDREVAKWDDTGNDIIVLAKHMCMIMMEMTDFTRYDLLKPSYKCIIISLLMLLYFRLGGEDLLKPQWMLLMQQKKFLKLEQN